MWQEFIEPCARYVDQQSAHTVSSLTHLVESLSHLIGSYQFVRNDLPYGRYLVHRDSSDRFNIQLDIFSENYEGAVHCHQTWGMLGVAKGTLLVEQWQQPGEGAFCKLGESVLTQGSLQSFCPPVSDWHKVRTLSHGIQVVTFHIYGKGFNLDEGIYLKPSLEPVKANRSPFKPLAEIAPYIKRG